MLYWVDCGLVRNDLKVQTIGKKSKRKNMKQFNPTVENIQTESQTIKYFLLCVLKNHLSLNYRMLFYQTCVRYFLLLIISSDK